jgi:hypothetical protein
MVVANATAVLAVTTKPPMIGKQAVCNVAVTTKPQPNTNPQTPPNPPTTAKQQPKTKPPTLTAGGVHTAMMTGVGTIAKCADTAKNTAGMTAAITGGADFAVKAAVGTSVTALSAELEIAWQCVKIS